MRVSNPYRLEHQVVSHHLGGLSRANLSLTIDVE